MKQLKRNMQNKHAFLTCATLFSNKQLILSLNYSFLLKYRTILRMYKRELEKKSVIQKKMEYFLNSISVYNILEVVLSAQAFKHFNIIAYVICYMYVYIEQTIRYVHPFSYIKSFFNILFIKSQTFYKSTILKKLKMLRKFSFKKVLLLTKYSSLKKLICSILFYNSIRLYTN